ncbi:CRISPR-associated helicase Cas3' [Nocardia terpenica]|uniref:CRISPR-associated helicase Cas3' n=1 Tax=Nocardia terpenica TaxID=455432 RepID=UPI00189522FE|nr:CRISPR-associated helicase Cas3' [Nocardia terpenica]MBF6063508.1 CRISPR-associated helicase Cas3' [Nocardia terpenica]MBF6106064.1 CRISPR-associated helicase Cas3' [Nocardia terpenica]MBF6113351.1 CRISPR-associated helicase Cas3' [Nocardia terpenica]MBF6119805.1 CRISPR-associated helicase Cas3' [Nocardia terpenica]MBF6152216.1 CRISPR-associated helicase Cas3' [Nocardia terpenica]
MSELGEVDLGLWGKSRGLPGPYPLICHLLDAAAAAGVLWDRYLSAGLRRFLAEGLGVEEGHARQLLVFLAGVHDVGKAMACFQMLDEAAFAVAQDYPVPVGQRQGHDYAVHVWLASVLVGRGFGRRAAGRIAQLLGGHHGCFFRLDSRAAAAPLAVVPELGAGAWERQRQLMVDVVYHVAGEPDPIHELEAAAAAVACAVVILADWLVSQTDFLIERLPVVPLRGDRESLRAFFGSAVADTPVLLDRAGLSRLRLRPGGFAEEHGLLPPCAPNALQRSVVDTLPGLLAGGGAGLLLVVAPMGFGKTETALTGARLLGEAAGAPGVMFALPTMATADPMYRRLSDYGMRRAVDPAPLVLLHSMAWLNSAYLPDEPDTGVSTGEDSNDAVAQRFMIAVAEWLLGAKRGLLAPWAIGTIDQVLLAGMRGRHNMVRMLGLAGKVLVVDEVHAYDAYMQQLLCRVLTWLGRLGVPVVLLSATLPRRVARRLVESYLGGSGHRLGEFSFPYPGWLYADARTGALDVFEFDCPATDLTIGLRAIPMGTDGRPDRISVLKQVLDPLITSSEGCVGIICNTVAEAQQTYRALHAWFTELQEHGRIPVGRTLLHSRFPADRREALTTDIVSRYGKDGDRPRGVVVATQVIEQSIDLDFDLIISDLAPVALLLQRAGRGHRHPRDRRPAWASIPRLEVLIPVKAELRPVLPPSWQSVYARSLLRHTAAALYARTGTSAEKFGVDAPPGGGPVTGVVRIPEDVQELMEQVYDESFATGVMADDDLENLADEQVERALADMVVVPDPDELEIAGLHKLTDHDIDDALFVTRLGADSGRVVWCYTDPDGTHWLDRAHTIPLPEHGAGPGGRFTKQQVKAVLAKSIPVPGTWVAHPVPDNVAPKTWDTNPYLRKILLLIEHPDRPGRAVLGTRLCHLDDDLGLGEVLQNAAAR